MELAVKLALLSAGGFFLSGLLTGAWKYIAIHRSENFEAPYYVNIAHRTSLLYAFACILLAEFAKLSAWSDSVNFWATLGPIVFFAESVLIYILHGFLRDTDNQLAKPHKLGNHTLPGSLIHLFMWLLIVVETGGFLVLFAGAAVTICAM